MTSLHVNISGITNAKRLAQYLRGLKFVDGVSIEEDIKPLTNDDWALPGRPATEAEIDKLLADMDKDGDEGYSSEEMYLALEQWKKKFA